MSTNGTHEKCNSGGAEKCSSGKFKRVNFFHGMLLTEEDFVEEQNYLREKLKLHNRLHGSGVVWGMELEKGRVQVGTRDAPRAVTKIFISPGLALDCAGNEIVVCESYLVPLDEKIEELRRFGKLTAYEKRYPPTYTGPRLYVGIRFCECKSQPAEQYTAECPDDRLRPQFSRVREGFAVQLYTPEELPGCHREHAGEGDAHKRPCPECRGLATCPEEEQVIILGYIEDYDASANVEPDHKDARLTPYENYPTAAGCAGESQWAYPRWEAQRQNVLRSVFGQTRYADVSQLIGRSVSAAEGWLKEKGLGRGKTYKLGQTAITAEFFKKVTNSTRWAAPFSVIDFVTGAGDDCIVFLIVNPSLSNVGAPLLTKEEYPRDIRLTQEKDLRDIRVTDTESPPSEK